MKKSAESQRAAARMPSLFEIFFGPLANWIRRRSQSRKTSRSRQWAPAARRTAARFEALEPRILLSADLSYMAGAGVLDATLRIVDDGGPTLQLVDTLTDAELARATLSGKSGFEASITGGAGDDTLQIDFGLAESFADLFDTSDLRLSFDGGGGNDTLISDTEHGAWRIDGADAGSLSGRAEIAFADVENLVGAADNEDTFIFEPDGVLSGGIDGGVGGFDTLVIDGGSYASAIFTASGPDSGTIDLDGNLIRYAGLEPLLLSAGTDELVIDATLFGDDLVLGRDPSDDTRWRLGDRDGLFPTMEEVIFDAPATSLTIRLGGGSDVLTINEFATGLGTSLTVLGGAGNDTVIVAEDALVSTRTISGTDHVNGQSTGDSGDILIEAETIEVRTGAKLLAHAIAGVASPDPAAGDITLIAEDVPLSIPTPFIDVTNTQSGITLDDAIVRGAAVTLQSSGLSDRSWDELGPGFDVIIDLLDSLSEFGGVAIANSSATVSLTGNTGIDAESVFIGAKATAEAEVRAVGVALSVAYGSSNPLAEITIGNDVDITTSGDLTIESNAESRVNVEAKQSLLGPNKPASAFDTTLAIGLATLTSNAWVQQGATLNVGGNLQLTAKQFKEHAVSSAAGAYEDGSVGAAFAISVSDSAVNALLDGDASVGGNVTVSARSDTANDTAAVAQVGTGIVGGLGIAAKDSVGLANATGSFFQQISPPTDQRGQGPTKFALSAAVAWANHENLSMARIGAGSVISSDGGDGVQIESRVKDDPEISGRAFVDSQKISEQNPAGNTKENSASTVVVVGNYSNSSEAYIGQAARVDATHGVAVDSETSIPLVIDWLQFAIPQGTSSDDLGDFATELASDISATANSNFGLQNGIFTSWAQANASGTKTALGFSVDVVNIDNSSHAWIAEGALVNQDAARRSGEQDVTVQATNLVEAVHLAGVFGLKFLGTSGGEGGVGGSYLEVDYGGAVTAQIHSGARVYADALLVRADSKTHNFSIAEAGGSASDLGINGAFSLVRENNRTLARIDDGAFIETGTGTLEIPRIVRDRFTPDTFGVLPFLGADPVVEDVLLALDSNGDGQLDESDEDIVSIDTGDDADSIRDDIYVTNLNQLVVAEDESSLINISGGVTKSQSVGVGFSVSINEIDRITEALVGNRQQAFGSADVDGDDDTIAFDGPHGYVTGEEFVYDPGEGTEVAPAGTYYTIVVDPRTIKLAASLEDAFADEPVAVDLTAPGSDDETQFLRSGADAAGSVEAQGRGKITAVNEGSISAWSVAGSVVTSGSTPDPEGQEAPKKGGKYGFGLSLSASFNAIDDVTRAYVESAQLDGFADLGIVARDTSNIFAVAGSVAISTSQTGIGGAGAWAQNVIRTDTAAYISDSGIGLSGDLNIIAENSGKILGIAASLSGAGKTGVAGSVSINRIDADARAYIADGSSVEILALTFDPAVALPDASGTIQLGYEHGLSDGARVVYRNGGGESIDGLTNGEIYFVDVVDDTAVQLARSAAEARSDPETNFDPASDVNVVLAQSALPPFDEVEVAVAGALFLGYRHGFRTGDAVVYRAGGGAPIGGLIDGQTYYVVRYDDRAVKLASTREQALAGEAIESLDPTLATGTEHNLRLAIDGEPAQGDAHFLAAAGNVELSASNDSIVHSVAAAPAFGGKGGIGASVAVNTILSVTEAYIADSDVDALNDITIRAESGNEIAGVSAAIGAATGPIAAAVAVSVNTITDATSAWIDGRLSEGVRAGGDVAVEAEASSTIFSLAGSLAGSTSGTGVGISTAVNVVNNSVEAAITGDAIVDSTSGDVRVEADQGPAVPQSGFATSALEALDLPVASTISSGAIGGGVASSLGLAGSVSVNVVTNESRAHIGERRGDAQSGQVTRVSAAGDVSVGAVDDAVISTAAGNIGGGGSGGVGIASTTIVTSNVVEAYIGVNAEVDAAARGDRSTAEGRGVSVIANSSEDIRTAAVAGAGGGTAGVAGSATVTVLNETTRAFVDRGARLNQAGGGAELQDVLVRASDDTSLFGLAGALAGGGSAGIGAGADVPVINKETEARIGAAAQVAANGSVEVEAVSTEDIVSISGAIGGGGSAGIAGTASVPVLDITTRAFIGPDRGESTPALSDTLITFESGILLSDSIRRSQGSWLEDGFAPGQSITVSGTNRNDGVYEIVDISADGRTLTLDTEVDIEVVPGADIQIAQNVAQGDTGAELSRDGDIGFAGNGTDPDTIVRAKGSWSDDGFEAGQLIVVSRSGLNDGIYRVAGISDDGLTMTLDGDAALVDESVAHAVLDITLVPTTVRAEGNVIVAAEAHTEIDLIAGNVTGAGAVNVGAAATVPVVNKETQAFIGRDAVVDAKANRAADDTLSGDFAITYEDPAFSIDNVPAPLFFVDGALSADLNFDGTNDLTDPSFTQQRISTPETTETKGVSVSAVNRDDIESAALSGGGSGTVAVNIGGSVNVVSTDTAAFVDRGARINSDAAGAGSEQSVHVAAGNDFYHMGMALVAGGSGTVAVTPGVDVSVVNHHTHAYIANETEVNARQDVVVSATALDDILSVSAGVAGSGLVSVGGAVSVITVNSSTHAHIGEETGSTEHGAQVRAGGNILISANDSTDIDVVAGSAGVGIGAVGVGASVAVTVVDKDTRAFVGDHAVLDALAGADGRADVLDGGLTDDGASTAADFHGLAVQAQSAESVFSLAATVGGGFYAGVGGGVTVEVIHSDTTAFIGEGARINADVGAADSDQSVNVSAFNETLVFAFAGGVGAGIAGIGGGVDVGVLRNNTSAYIGNGAEVQARRNVDVNALSLKDVDSVAASAGVGLVGAVGSVTVWAIGTRTDATYSEGDTSANALETSGDGSSEAPQYGNVQDFVDAMAGGGDPGNPSGEDNNGYTALLDGHARSAFDPSLAVDDSQDSIDLGADHGFADGDAVVYRSGGGDSIGGLIDGETYYVIGTDDPGRVQLAAAQNDALDGSAIDLDASVASGDSHELVSQLGDVVGTADGEVEQSAPADPASAATGETEVTSGTTAFIGENARVQAGDDISLRAREDIDFDAIAGSVAVGAAGIGGSVVVANLRSNTDAHVAGGSVLTAGADADDELLISAHLDESASARAYAGQVGAATLGAQVAVINDSSVQQAYVEDGAVIAGANSVRISATANITVSAHAIGGGVGGSAIGAAVAVANIDGTTQAFIDGAVVGRESAGAPAAVPTVGSVDIAAASAASADALAIAVVAGLASSTNASVATANVDPEVKAFIGADADVAALHDIDIGASAEMQSTADALGVAVGGSNGLGVSVAVAMLSPAVSAHVGQNANVTAGNDVKLRARSNVETNGARLDKGARASATSGSGGLAVGGAGAFAFATVAPDIETYVDSASTVTAANDVLLLSQANSVTPTVSIGGIELAGAQASGAGFGAVGVGVSVAGTEIGGSVIARVDDAAIAAGRDVRIGAESAAQGSAGAQAVAGGIAGGAGNGATVSISPTVSGYIGAGADVDAGNDVAVTAHSEADADADARGVSVGIGISIGVSIVRAEIAPTVTTYIGAGASVDAGGDVILGSLHNVDEEGNALEKSARATGAASGGGALAGNGVDADAISDATVRSYADSTGSGPDTVYAQIDAGGDVTIQAMSANDAGANANGLTIGLVGIGVILGEARSDGTTEAYLGAGTLLTAGANLLLESSAHSTSSVSAVASGGGVASGQGAHAAAAASPTGSAYVGSGARVQTGQDARVAMRATNSSTASTGGGSFGGLAVGASLADANIGGSAETRVDAGAEIIAGRDVSIGTHSDDDAQATATATSGGVAGGAGADSDADVTRQINAVTASATRLSAGQDVEISARALVRSGAEATGTTAGGIGVGSSSATASEDITVNATLTGEVDAGRNATVEGLYNIDQTGAGVQDALSARATGSAGSLVAGILLGADALATSEVSVTTLVSGGSTVDAANDVVVVSGAYNSADVNATGNAGGLIAVGSGSATSAEADMDTAASTVIGSGAALTAGRDQMIASGAITDVSALATGSSGQNFGSAFENLLTTGLSGFFSGDNIPSIFSNGGTVAQVTVANSATTDVRTGARLEAGNGLGVSASAEVIVDAESTMSGASAFIADAVAVTDVFIDSDAVVLLGDGAFLVADHVEISAHNRIDAIANADADVTADLAQGTVTAISGLNVGTNADPSEARVNLGAANITGRESVLIEALNSQGSAPLVASATGEAFGGITSTSSALADGSAEVRARVDSSPGMVLTTAELAVRSDSTFVLQRDPEATADTVVTRLVEQIRTIQREVEQRVCKWFPWPLNLVCRVVTKVITETIINVVEVADFSSEFTRRTGSGLDAQESINLNGDIFNFGAGNLQLVVDADGSVNPASNIGAVVDGDNIVVNPILSGGTANILFDTPQGTIGGNAVLHLSKVIEEVSVVNHSNLNLVFGTVELVADSGLDDIETAPDVDYTSVNAFEYEIDSEIVDSRFDVRNNGTGDILFTDSVENVSAKFSIVNEGGDILMQDDSVQFEVGSGSNPGEGDNIVLSAAAGSIGSADNPFNLRLVRGLQLPDGSPNDAPLQVSGTAGEDIHLDVVGVVNTFEPFDPADRVEGILFDLDAGRDVSVAVTRSEVLDVDQVSHSGHTHAHGGESHSHAVEGSYDFRNVSALTGDAVLTVTAGDQNIGLVHAGASAILSASRSILDADDDAASDVNAIHVVLNAGADIGAADNALEIDSRSGGTVTATAIQDIHLDEVADDLHVVRADSAMGAVNLTAAGAIAGAGIDPVSDVSGVAVRLIAGTGIDLRVDSNGGLVDATAQQDVYLRETVGDLRLGRVVSAGGDVRLEAAGSILDGQGGTGNNVEAANVRLAAEGGSIGAGDNAVEIDSGGLVTASGLQSIFLAETAGDLVLDLIASSLGAVQLTAAAAIRDGDDDAGIDISATAAVLIAGTGIGASGNALETAIGALDADAGSGGLWMVNSGALEVGDVTAAGDVSIVALSPITVTGAIVGADVFLEAADTPGPGDDLTVRSGASITAAGDVGLIAGDDLVIEAGSTVNAAGAVSLSVGGNLLLSGTILADSLSLEGNDNDNVFVITTLATDTTLRTHGGNDIIHVGSDATFVSNTGGHVNAINATLVIDAGNGSGFDTLTVDDSGDAADNSGVLTANSITGLGMTGGRIDYSGIEDLAIALGSSDDALTILSTHQSDTRVHTGAGADTVNVGSGSVNGIDGALFIDGGNTEGNDTLNIDDQSDTAGKAGTLTGSALTGLGMAAGIDYSGIEVLNIDLGSGADVFNVQGTSAVTNLALNDGDDRIHVSSEASADLLNHAGIDFLPGHLDDIQGALNIDAGAGRHQLMVSDESATAGDTDVAISDMQPVDADLSATAEIWITGLAPAGISFEASRTDGNFHDGISIWTGSGDDTVRIDGTHERLGARTTTVLHTGLGDDHVTVALDAGEDGALQLHVGGGDDTVDGSASTLPLVIFGGAGDDGLTGGSGGDVMFGDYGRVEYRDGFSNALAQAYSVEPQVAGNDTLHGLGGDDLLIGGSGDDGMFGGTGDDIMAGDNAQIIFDVAGVVHTVGTIARTVGGVDTLYGADGEDVLIGGAAGDRLDGGAGDDLIFGDNVRLERKDDYLNPRFRTLQGTQLYGQGVNVNGSPSGEVLVTGDPQFQPEGAPTWDSFAIELLDHSHSDEEAGLNNFGDDTIAGGAGNDQIFGQLGDDVIQGDGSIDLAVSAWRDENGLLQISASADAETDGDDYIEGGGGNDVIFGNLGQDDIIGGSSSLFSLTERSQHPDGADLIFGGSGTLIARNDAGRSGADAHARDADTILGDNGNLYRIVGAGGDYVVFNYDALDPERGDLRIVPRAAELLDYTPGGPDYDPAAAALDIGAGDELHGESGDDVIYGMTGNDVLFGEGQDDDLIGGWGHDWISGGSGQDGILGDDGRIFTSRNGIAEPLYGIAETTQTTISTPGNIQQATIHVDGELKKSVDLTPFNVDPDTEGQDPLYRPSHADDIIYGGLGGDFLHGGSGGDAISGAEALELYYDRPFNPGNILRYSTTTGEFAEYDEFNPRVEIFYTQDVVFNLPDGGTYVLHAGDPFILNFDPTEGPDVASTEYGTVQTDGDDKIFGDLGNDWLVGGTGRDNLYGGWGDDLLNADDDHRTNGGLNDTTDTHPSYEDRAYGGAGRDVLIANTEDDRLIDWAGNFNVYLAPAEGHTVSRSLAPQIAEFLYDLSEADGADQTRSADTGADPARNGEPEGELGMVRQQDAAWQDQTGQSSVQFASVQSVTEATGGIDWQGQADGGWNTRFSPFASARAKPAQNISDFLFKLAASDSDDGESDGDAESAGYDELGAALGIGDADQSDGKSRRGGPGKAVR
ncbi:MAG: LEPR-XLL domain-containing protein [Burkholderiales bacterium]